MPSFFPSSHLDQLHGCAGEITAVNKESRVTAKSNAAVIPLSAQHKTDAEDSICKKNGLKRQVNSSTALTCWSSVLGKLYCPRHSQPVQQASIYITITLDVNSNKESKACFKSMKSNINQSLLKWLENAFLYQGCASLKFKSLSTGRNNKGYDNVIHVHSAESLEAALQKWCKTQNNQHKLFLAISFVLQPPIPHQWDDEGRMAENTFFLFKIKYWLAFHLEMLYLHLDLENNRWTCVRLFISWSKCRISFEILQILAVLQEILYKTN